MIEPEIMRHHNWRYAIGSWHKGAFGTVNLDRANAPQQEETTMNTAIVTRKSRNIGIAATAYANNGPNGWYFEPLDKPSHVGGCATIRRQLAEYRRLWSGGTYYRIDLFIAGNRVAHDTGSYERLVEFCHDTRDRYDESVTVYLEENSNVEAR